MSSPNYAPFCDKTATYIINSFDSWMNILEGGKRAGKNIANIIAFIQAIEAHPEKLHMIGGVTKANAEMNIIDCNGFGLEHYFGSRCKRGKYNKRECLFIDTDSGRKVVLIAGGKDADDFRMIKGFSLGVVYITEANECHLTFIRECIDRTLASAKRTIIFDINPKSPRHWFYTEIMDFYDELKKRGKNEGYNYSHLNLFDNYSLSNDKIRAELERYNKASLWYRADILGERIAATGRIYDGFSADFVVNIPAMLKLRELHSKPNATIKYFSIGVDIGGTDATVATLTGFTEKRADTLLLDGYYHKQGKSAGMTHDSYAKKIVEKISFWVEAYPGCYGCALWVESADKLFRQALQYQLRLAGLDRFIIYPSYKKDKIIDRIRLNCILISQGRFYIAQHLEEWILAYYNAVWDDKYYDKGDWIRVDDGSYPVDCLDSVEYSIQPYKKELIQGG